MKTPLLVLGCSLALLAAGHPAHAQPAPTQPAQTQQAPAQPDPCTDATAAYAARHFAEAAPLFAACTRTATDPTLLLQQARSLLNTNQLPAAQGTALDLLTLSPNSAPAMYLLGHVLQRDNHPTESLDWFTRAAAIAKPTAEDLRTVALDYVLLNDYPDAIRWLERAVSIDPANADAWYDLGRAHMMQGNPTAAEKALRTALQLQPGSSKAENNLGVTFEAENRIPEALAAYKLAIAWQTADTQLTGPHTQTADAQPFLNLGTLLITQQHAAEALPLLQQAVTLAPQEGKAHEQLARALEQTGNLPAALPEMQSAVTLAPADPRLHYELGQMLRRAGHAAEARDELRRSADLYGSHSTPAAP